MRWHVRVRLYDYDRFHDAPLVRDDVPMGGAPHNRVLRQQMLPQKAYRIPTKLHIAYKYPFFFHFCISR